jgi:rubrerythrin
MQHFDCSSVVLAAGVERIVLNQEWRWNMLSKIPIHLNRVKKEGLDKEILRSAMIAELDAINLYEQMADMTQNKNIRKLLLDVAREEKTHVGEFQALLLIEDKEQRRELEEGREEVRELLRKGKT